MEHSINIHFFHDLLIWLFSFVLIKKNFHRGTLLLFSNAR